jgi:hypothetical protein
MMPRPNEPSPKTSYDYSSLAGGTRPAVAEREAGLYRLLGTSLSCLRGPMVRITLFISQAFRKGISDG